MPPTKRRCCYIGCFMNIAFHLLVVGAGISVALQQVLNANLRAELESPWWARCISYVGGTVVMLAVIVASGEPWLSSTMVARTSWISWTGGIFGALFIGCLLYTSDAADE